MNGKLKEFVKVILTESEGLDALIETCNDLMKENSTDVVLAENYLQLSIASLRTRCTLLKKRIEQEGLY